MSLGTTQRSLTYRPDIDGLRAIAVLSVVVFHAFPERLTGGFVGVDIFFVISGFLISGIILSETERRDFSYRDFYVRRIKRIFPALILVLISCMFFGWWGLMPDEYGQLGKYVAAGAAFIANFAFQADLGYFDNSAETKPLLHLWSLSVEEQFYIVWPPLLLLAWKSKWNLLYVVFAIATVSFLSGLYGAAVDPQASFFSPWARFWELLIGGLLAYISRYKHEWLLRYGELRSIAGIALLVIAILYIDETRPFPGAMALVPTMGAFLIISAGPAAFLNKRLLSSRLLVWIGLISYPLYLWHWPLLAFNHIFEGAIPSVSHRFKAIGIAIILATLTYYLVERPLRRASHAGLKAVVLVTTMLIIGIFGLYVYQQDGMQNRTTITRYLSTEANDQFVGPLWAYTKNDICTNRFPYAEAAEYRWWFCMLSKDESPTVLLLGNSYANQFYPGLVKHPRFNHHAVLSIGACDAAGPAANSPASNDPTSPCSGNRAQEQQLWIDDIIEKNKNLQYVIIDGLPAKPTADYIERLNQRIDYIEEHGIKVVVFVPQLLLNYHIKGCYSRLFKPARFDCTVDISEHRRLLAEFEPLARRVTQSGNNVFVFDQNRLFCGENSCSMIRDGMPLLRDEFNHMSEYGSIELGKLFAKWADETLPGMLSE